MFFFFIYLDKIVYINIYGWIGVDIYVSNELGITILKIIFGFPSKTTKECAQFPEWLKFHPIRAKTIDQLF